MSSVAVIVSVAASKKCTLCAVLGVTIRWGPPCRLLRSNIASSAKIGGSHPHEAAEPTAAAPVQCPGFPHRRRRMPAEQADPRHHTRKMQARLREIMDHLREDIKKVDEPQFKAMFETAAEVLGGLVKAFEDYEKKSEPAWR